MWEAPEKQVSQKLETSMHKPAPLKSSKPLHHPRLQLQQTVGNQAVQRMLRSAEGPDSAADSGQGVLHRTAFSAPGAAMLQRKLQINQPGDTYEQEADRISEQVMRMPAPAGLPAASPAKISGGGPASVQRECACGGTCAKCQKGDQEHEHARVQLKATGAATSETAEAPPIVHEVLRSSGQPLDRATREYMEPRFGHDFSGVRVHTDGKAAESARAVGARAYTAGHNVVFGAGEHAPGTQEGQRLLGHELTHVMQQSHHAVAGLQRAEDWNFTPEDFGELTKKKGSLKFDSDSSWFPSALQTNLLDTLNFVLDPTRKKPATKGVNTEDFFHGHVAMKGQKSSGLNQRTGEYNKIGEEEYAKALGGSRINDLTTKNLPAYKAAVEKTLPSAQALLEEAAKLKDVVVIYHTFETNKPSDMKFGSPERNFITALGGSPKPYSPPNPDSAGSWANEFTDIFQFNFLVDEKGIIHVRPGFASSTRELSTITGKPEK